MDVLNRGLKKSAFYSFLLKSFFFFFYQFQTAQRGNLEKLRLVQWQILSRPSPEGILL
jgi:hypothetical protein